jgi:hypothetical protein
MAPKGDARPEGPADPHPWVREFPATLTVIDKDGAIIDLTERAAKAFAGEFAGYLETTLEIPADMPHDDRDAK